VLGAEALEEQDELQFEEHHRINGRPTYGRVVIADQLADEREVELRLQVPVEVVRRDERLQRDHYRTIQTALLPRTEHQPNPRARHPINLTVTGGY
jgi:hypothetical protein